eukprot:6173858-Pleurochrysis_carterae.AAC.2
MMFPAGRRSRQKSTYNELADSLSPTSHQPNSAAPDSYIAFYSMISLTALACSRRFEGFETICLCRVCCAARRVIPKVCKRAEIPVTTREARAGRFVVVQNNSPDVPDPVRAATSQLRDAFR